MAIKLSPAVAAEIRRRAKAGEHPKELARRYGVSRPHISNILSGGIWRTAGTQPTSRRGPVPWEEIAHWVERAGIAERAGGPTR